jgi:hypothetical protein
VYLAERFVPQHNATFARPPRDPESAFVPLGTADLDTILCHEETRIVARDNTVRVDGRPLQLGRQPGRRSCAGLEVTVRHHLDGRITICHGPRLYATFPGTEGSGGGFQAAEGAQNAPPAAWNPPRTQVAKRAEAAL